jgi:hypothetical protein
MPFGFKRRSVLSRSLGAFFVAASIAVAAYGEEAPAREVVFVSPRDRELDASLRDSLTAQFSGMGAEIVFESFPDEAAALREKVAEARSLAVAHQAVGVFWLDAQAGGDWLLYLAEPRGDRVLVRRLPVDANGVGAAVEATAVIAKQSTAALLSGQTIGMQPVAIAPESAPAPPPLSDEGEAPPEPVHPVVVGPSPLRGLSVSLAYAGDAFAAQVPWQSGLRLRVGYTWPFGGYVAAGFVRYNDVNVGASDIAFRVGRVPFDGALGYTVRTGRFGASFEARPILELASRHVLSVAAPLARTPDATRQVVLLSPRARFEYTFTRVFGVYLGGGVDFALNEFSFVTRVDGHDRALLEPRRVRPAAELGVSFWP